MLFPQRLGGFKILKGKKSLILFLEFWVEPRTRDRGGTHQMTQETSPKDSEQRSNSSDLSPNCLYRTEPEMEMSARGGIRASSAG